MGQYEEARCVQGVSHRLGDMIEGTPVIEGTPRRTDQGEAEVVMDQYDKIADVEEMARQLEEMDGDGSRRMEAIVASQQIETIVDDLYASVREHRGDLSAMMHDVTSAVEKFGQLPR